MNEVSRRPVSLAGMQWTSTPQDARAAKQRSDAHHSAEVGTEVGMEEALVRGVSEWSRCIADAARVVGCRVLERHSMYGPRVSPKEKRPLVE